MRGDERVANLIPLRAQYFELAVTADVIRDGLAHLSDALPPAHALRKLVGDLGLLLNANLFERHVVPHRFPPERFCARILGVGLIE